MFGESADIKNDCEDTADSIGDDAPFSLVKIRASVIVLKYPRNRGYGKWRGRILEVYPVE